jgi:uncharacterized protein YycO
MKRHLLAALAALVALPSCLGSEAYEPRNGDIVFHTSRSAQSVAIQRATGSPYSHLGVVYIHDGRPQVFEAVEPVKLTPLAEWTARGAGGHFVVKRLSNADSVLTEDALARMLQVGQGFLGKHYDLTFAWSDDRLYCSELVWKVYQRALGVELGQPQPMGRFDVSDPVVQGKIWERFGGVLPPDEPVISPAAVFSSCQLTTVFSR